MKQRHNQQGSVLALAMVFLLLTSLVSVTVMNTNLFESRMINNEQMHQEAFSLAEAAANAIIANANTTPGLFVPGFTSCGVGSAQSGCTQKVNLIVDAGLEAKVGNYSVTGVNSQIDTVPANPTAGIGYFYYEVVAVIDNTATGQGRSRIVVGARAAQPLSNSNLNKDISQ